MATKKKTSTRKPKALPAPAPAPTTLPFDVDPARVEETLKKLQDELLHWAKKGRYTKVRFKFRGKALLPDIPLAAVAAAQGLTFYWGGLLRALVFTLAGKSVLDVELVSDADGKVDAGKAALLDGEIDTALARFAEALEMDRDHAGAHLNTGVALKLRGDREGAKQAFEKARKAAGEGPLAAEAQRLLEGLEKRST